MKIKLLFICLGITTALQAQSSLVDWVNPLMGTQSKPELSNGNTYPAVAVPWGMNFWTAQTGKMGNGWAYTYDADKIRGFKQTHQPSPWMNDYGQFALMPMTGTLRYDEDLRASWFSHKSEKATPYYYQVYLADENTNVEITPTERAAQFRFTFPKNEPAWVLLDAFDKGSEVKIIPQERKIVGYSTKYSSGKLVNFRNYFVIQFDTDFVSAGTLKDSLWSENQNAQNGNHTMASVKFLIKNQNTVHARVASSFISLAQAEISLNREIGKDNFEETEQKAKKLWNTQLDKIKIEGGSDAQMRTFYSCLYRTLFFPNKMYEIDAQGNRVHWSPYNGKVEAGYRFAGTGFWDTFRALYPLLNLAYPSICKEMQEGLINDYKEGGWLPEWSSPGYSNIMIGNNSASIVAEAYLKGARGYDIETLYQALLHGANNEGPITAVGRAGVNYYNTLGYVPYDVKINENAARTLEYAYDDFAIYQLGKLLKKPASEIDIYAKRALNYKNIFDSSTGLMRGKNKDGTFQSPFNPYKWGDAFTEGNSWHYTWSVFQDVQGLIDLMGGNEHFTQKLDSVFSQAPIFDDSYYGGIIHEIREMQIAQMGQYAHGNQPIQHMIYLYDYAGKPWLTQYWARETMNRMYKATPDGYCGDEDNGQTSAWYIFSALGFYPVTPAYPQYALGAPLFPKATISLENGHQIVLKAAHNSDQNKYVNSLSINGKMSGQNWLNHADMMKGINVQFSMSAKPNLTRGLQRKDAPYSFSNEYKNH